MMKQGQLRRSAAAVGAAFALGFAASVAKAELATLCAEVKLEILQEAALEREAFDASLKVNNNLPDQPLTNLRVNIIVKDEQGNPADGAFFIKISTLVNTNAIDGAGVVQSSSTAEIRWLIIPSTGAGGALPGGKRYSVRAVINGTSAGAPQSVTTFDDFITVYPQPSLKLEYVLPYEVFGDEPLTGAIEPIEPFPLGVRVTNIGYGTAKNFQIESAQPRIVENKQSLPIDFKLLGAVVGGKTIPNTLLVPFGDVAAGGVGQASWIMSTTLSGRFVSFTSTFTHAAELGGQLTSLIQSVTTYTLLRDVLVDLPGRDATPDFLVNTTMERGGMQALLDAGGQPPAELILESDQPAPLAVLEVPAVLSGSLGGASAALTLAFTQGVGPNLWVHASAPIVWSPGMALQSARASDGRMLNARNAWISKHFRKSDASVSYRVNILDLTSAAASYTINFDPASLDASPGGVLDLAATAPPLGGALDLSWTAPGEDGYAGDILGGRYLIGRSISSAAVFSPALAEVNFATSTSPGRSEAYALRGIIGNATTYLRLWTQDTGGAISPISNSAMAYALPNPPRELSLTAVASTTARAAWQAGNNSLPIEYRVCAATAADGAIVSSSPYKDSFDREFIFTGLSPSTTYVVFGEARNPDTASASPRAELGRFMTSVSDADTTPPVTSLQVNGVTVAATSVIAISTDALGFDAADGGAGVLETRYILDASTFSLIFNSTFSLSAGTHTLAFHSIDRAGNVEPSRSVALGVLVYDVAPPSLAMTPPSSSFVTTQRPTISALYADAGRGVDNASVLLTLDGADVTDLSAVSAFSAVFTPTSDLAQGAHTATAQLFDLAGNHASAVSSFFLDSIPPVTTLQVDGLAESSTSLLLISTGTLGFAATDGGSGVLEIRYALDGSTTEAVFVSTFSLDVGPHTLAYRGLDRAGNAEALKSASLFVFDPDATPPDLTLTPSEGSTVTVVSPSIVVSYSDFGRGVDITSVRLGLDGVDLTTQAVVSASSAAFTPAVALSQGFHILTAQVSDLAGNSAAATSIFRIDSVPPVTTLLVNGLTASTTSLVLVSTDSLGFAATDSGVGVLETRCSVDDAAEVVFSSTFSLAAGVHTLAFRSSDRAGNAEPVHSVSIAVAIPSSDNMPPSLVLSPVLGSTLTTIMPTLRASYADLGFGVDVSSVRLSLDGIDRTSSATVTASSASFTPSAALTQGEHRFAASVSDLAGNPASAALTFFIDSLPPVTALLANGLSVGATNVILVSTDSLGFAAMDEGTGVLETRYVVDSDTEAVFVSTFGLAVGAHTVVFRSVDRAGNQESVKTVAITVISPISDNTPPLVRLDFPGSSALGVEQAVGGVVNVRGVVSDASAVSWTLEAAPGAAATGGFTTIASGVGSRSGLIAAWDTASLLGYRTLCLRASDAFGNTAQTTATVFVGKPVMTTAIGRKNSNFIVNKLKNPTGIAVRPDGKIWVASAEENELLLLTPSGGVVAEIDGKAGRKHGHDDDDFGFKNPQGLALDVLGNLYVADTGNDRIVKLSADGARIMLELRGLRRPRDVAVDANGDIYAADTGNHRIQVFNSSGTVLRQFGSGVLLSTSEVRGIALTSEGLWVSDKQLERLFLFSRMGALIKSIGDADSAVGEISRMRGLASDRLGALYVVEPNRDRTQKFDPQGKGLLAFGSSAGLSNADKRAYRYLSVPIDAAIAPDGSIWITDSGRDRIVRYALPAAGGMGAAAYSAGGDMLSAGSVSAVRRVVDAQDGAKVEREDGAGVAVPRGALTDDIEITVDTGDENQDKERKTAKRRERKIAPVSEEVQYGPEGTSFNTPVTLTLPYDANLVATQGIREDELKVYYWNATLKDWQAMASVIDKQNKTVSAQTSHFSMYQVQGPGAGIGVAAAIDEFSLRDGYAFPNPSRSGSAVTFRMQPGLADSVEVRVYDVSGRKIHSSSDFRFSVLDDGNGKGGQNTYDHAWDVSGVASGVYTYVITAKKAGQSDISKTGKAGVVK